MTTITERRPDYLLLFILAALLSIGLIMVFSASPTLGMKIGDSFYYLRKHITYLFFGFVAMVFGLRTDYRQLSKWSVPLIILSFGLLLAVFVPGVGRSAGGAVRWIDILFLSFQPSEIVKISVVIFLASILSSWNGEEGSTLRILSVSILPVLMLALLVIKQPDLGTAIVIVGTSFIMLFIAGIATKYLAYLGGALLGLLVLISVTSAYRLKRLMAFIDPWKAPHDVGFHIIQSLLAIGSGGILGLGLGESRQKFFYLPQHYTDFIFSILGEELGLFGALGVIFLFMVFVIRGVRIARFAPDRFGRLLAGGIVSWIALQAMINLYVVTGMFPTTGIPLPFISFGGTALVVTLYAVGVLLNISKGQLS